MGQLTSQVAYVQCYLYQIIPSFFFLSLPYFGLCFILGQEDLVYLEPVISHFFNWQHLINIMLLFAITSVQNYI